MTPTLQPCKMVASGKSESGIELVPVEVHKAEVPYSTAKVSVWWDLETTLGSGKMSDPHLMANSIRLSLVNMGYTGPISTLFAYGNGKLIHNSFQQALTSSGIIFVDIPDVNYPISKEILEDMIFWTADNAFPASLMLISNGRINFGAINGMKRRKYNIILARLSDTTDADADADADAS